MKTVAIIQARMGSTRLPGKVMKELCGKTILAHVINRVKLCPLIDEVVIATTTHSQDDVIIQEAEQYDIQWFRGSETNVLERYYQAAKRFEADVIVRVTSDCPLFDPDILTEMLDYFQTETSQGLSIDYLSNSLNRSYPRGLDAEIFTIAALEKSYLEAQLDYEKEHVTPYIYQHPELFSLHNQSWDEDFSEYRWTLDTEEDWQFISKIYQELYRKEKTFNTDEILEFLDENPHLQLINGHIQQKKLGD